MAFVFDFFPDQYKTQEMCETQSLAALKLIPDWFSTSKMIKELFTALFTDEICSTLMKILVMSYFLVMKWVLVVNGCKS